MNHLDILILAIIQGIAEFLPISSSGHLVLVGHWLGIEEAKGTVNIILHAGTLLSIVVFYFHRIAKLIHEDRRVVPLLVVGTTPGVVAGYLIKSRGEWLIESPWLAASMLLVTGGMLLASAWIRKETEQDYRRAGWGTAIGVGIAQAFAILPGISRSGATICTGLWLGLKRESAGTFSFLLAIPIIAGASVYEILRLNQSDTADHPGWFTLSLGMAISFAVGLASLYWLSRMIEKGKFHLFAWWCIPFGLLSLLLLALLG